MLLNLEDALVSIGVDILETREIDAPLHPSPVMNKVDDERAKPFLLALRTSWTSNLLSARVNKFRKSLFFV